MITLEVKDKKDDRSAEERCNLPPKDSFEESEIPDEGDRAADREE